MSDINDQTRSTPNVKYRDRYRTYSKRHPFISFRVSEENLKLYKDLAEDAYYSGIIRRPSVGLIAKYALVMYYSYKSHVLAEKSGRLARNAKV